jgi:hypothetical protein
VKNKIKLLNHRGKNIFNPSNDEREAIRKLIGTFVAYPIFIEPI